MLIWNWNWRVIADLRNFCNLHVSKHDIRLTRVEETLKTIKMDDLKLKWQIPIVYNPIVKVLSIKEVLKQLLVLKT
jgi:hypothetical protein